jgi:hypothetical protein
MGEERAVRMAKLVIPGRFNGPADSGNGGYVAGRLAQTYARLTARGGTAAAADAAAAGASSAGPTASAGSAGAVTVTLRQPPPLDVGLDLAVDVEGRLVATFGGAVIATAEAGVLSGDPIEPVGPDAARAAQESYAGLRAHPFPTCFVCGPARPGHDGLGLSPGRLGPDPADRVACTWVPDESLAPDGGAATVGQEFVWAALDCPSGWASDLEARPMVLGRITAAVDEVPRVGETCVVTARVLASEGRKSFTASTAYDSDGRILGRAEATWIAIA